MKKFLCAIIIIIMCFGAVNTKASNTFYDTRGTKYEGVVERMAKLGIVNGMTSTTYAPYKGVTRAELAKIITQMKGIEDYADSVEYKKMFKDVKRNDWFYPYVMIAADLGLINGYEDETFKPNQEVTYAELVAILLRNLGYTRLGETHENGWYWNYVVKMREIDLNDNIGEFDYTDSAKRGDVAMFVWNALITDRWAIVLENEKEGFTYTYSEKTPLEVYFDEYGFLDNTKVNYLAGKEEKIMISTSKGNFYTNEKTPLYVLGGNITALYSNKTRELIGVTFDEDYDNIDIVSGPKFYLEEQGYRIGRVSKTAHYGTKSKANFVYLIINKETNEIIRTVYLDSSNYQIVDTISVTTEDNSGDIGLLKTIKINDEEFSSEWLALIDNGFGKSFNTIKKGDILTYLGNGLYAYSNTKITDKLTGFKYNTDKISINEDEYIISENCICYMYKEKDPISYDSLSSKELSKYIDKDITAYLNVSEEICVINFGKTDEDNEKYKIGFVTEVYATDEEKSQRVKVDFGDDRTGIRNVKITGNNFIEIGDLVSISEKDGKDNYEIITRDKAFDNDISIKYNYDAKKIKYPMIGEYMVTEDTIYYKVNLKYENNSITKIKSVELNKLEIGKELDDLEAYNLILIYNEDMEIIKIYAVNEMNRFDNQIALIRDVNRIWENKSKVLKVSLSVMGDAVRGYKVSANEDKFVKGDIITFTYTENGDTRIATLEEIFKKEFIGYKRDLVVKSFDRNNGIVYFENGNDMYLNKDIYNWNGEKINLNKYRFVIANVSDTFGFWEFSDLEMHEKERLILREKDRIAIGEIQGVIVIYRGYDE